MAETAGGGVEAFDAKAVTADNTDPRPDALRAYDEQVAAQEDDAIAAVEATIASLQESLKERKAARAARRKRG